MHSTKAGIISAMIGGALVTLATGLARTTPYGLVGASWYGFPTAWLYRLVIAPIYNPWVISPGNFVLDFTFWFVVALIILGIISICGSQKNAGKKARK